MILYFSDADGAFACDIVIVSSKSTLFVGYRGLGLVLSQSQIREWNECIGAEYYIGFAAPILTARMMFL
jgi:hypothetical protein